MGGSVVSAPVLGAPFDPALVEALPRLRAPGRPRHRPFEAVILELDGVLTRPALARGRASGARAAAVEACRDTAAALRRWRRSALPCAAIGRGPDAHCVLRAAGLRDAIDVVLDDRAAAELGLRGDAEVLLAAVARMGVLPRDAVALCSSPAMVTAARRAGLGLVVGVDRDGRGRTLTDAGAHRITHNAFMLRFPRRLPSALDMRHTLGARRGDRSLAVFLDYDGTLTPSVNDPAAAVLSSAMRATLEALADRWPVAILSGRDRDDVEARVGVSDLFYAGSHGLDIAGRGLRRVPPEAERAIPELDEALARLTERVGGVPGVLFERKRFSLAVHHRMVADPDDVARVERAVDAALVGTHLRRREGKRVIELLPDVEWDKGRALRWILEVQGLDMHRTFPIHIGDDETDEDAFAALAGMGAGIRVGSPVASTLAEWYVRNPDEVAELLAWLEHPTPLG
jgi:trehalose 6-phosphate phosphatase